MKELLGRYRFQKGLYYSAIVIIVVSSLAQGFIVPDKGRLLHKQAGLYLKERDPGKLIARIEPVGMAVTPIEGDFQETEAGWVLSLELAPGLYRLEVRTRQAGPLVPSPVHDIFEVIP